MKQNNAVPLSQIIRSMLTFTYYFQEATNLNKLTVFY
jgi:hypothetical protein